MEMQLRAVQVNTSPLYLTKKAEDWEGWRAANEAELRGFAKKYKPGSLLVVHGVGSHIEPSYFGPMVRVFKTKPKGIVVRADVNPICGLPPRTLVLWVKEEGAIGNFGGREPRTWDLNEHPQKKDGPLVEEVEMKIANSIRKKQGEGTPAPEGFEAWATKYFSQPACGEMMFEAPLHFTKENPQAAIGWYEENIGPLSEDEKEKLLKTRR